ncbi:Inosine-5'-monophosphate dehydrogenase [Dissulfuribacter thermophilus]|uniref:Inosine-5'-monophosphate dehydrogenase n=2 Tax=Dissulfuribacter thermophilus TaxID=1156395 RepID=A0A1B9F7W7_9BACT|nr:Inosine-5'-monophosphate dehydrogenase [Dissulfuribacter thermophilus]
MGVGEICNREVVIVAPEESVLTATRLMKNHSVGCLVVIKDERPVGILTDRDIAIRVVASSLNPEQTIVQEVMSSKLVKIREDQGIGDTIRLMRSASVRRIPVVSDKDDSLVGIITLDDLLDLIAEEMDELVKLIRRQQAQSFRV